MRPHEVEESPSNRSPTEGADRGADREGTTRDKPSNDMHMGQRSADADERDLTTAALRFARRGRRPIETFLSSYRPRGSAVPSMSLGSRRIRGEKSRVPGRTRHAGGPPPAPRRLAFRAGCPRSRREKRAATTGPGRPSSQSRPGSACGARSSRARHVGPPARAGARRGNAVRSRLLGAGETSESMR